MSLNSAPAVLALTDAITGHTNQTLAIADLLGFVYGTLNIEYTPLAVLPNALIRDTGIGLGKATCSALSGAKSDIIISTGRRAAQAALYAKRQHPHATLIHCLWPDALPDQFDAIIVPTHDGRAKQAGQNLLTTPLIPHRITAEKLEAAKAQWASVFAQLPQPHIGMLVGGDSKHGVFSPEDYKTALQRAASLAGEGSLIISASRRTDISTLKAALKTLPVYYYLYSPDDAGENPYLGILACSDGLVVTADSISMVSEACATQAPVYVYRPQNMKSAKIERFLSHLESSGKIMTLTKDLTLLTSRTTDASDAFSPLKNTLYAWLGLDETQKGD